jgi:hypothetical protein
MNEIHHTETVMDKSTHLQLSLKITRLLHGVGQCGRFVKQNILANFLLCKIKF